MWHPVVAEQCMQDNLCGVMMNSVDHIQSDVYCIYSLWKQARFSWRIIPIVKPQNAYGALQKSSPKVQETNTWCWRKVDFLYGQMELQQWRHYLSSLYKLFLLNSPTPLPGWYFSPIRSVFCNLQVHIFWVHWKFKVADGLREMCLIRCLSS